MSPTQTRIGKQALGALIVLGVVIGLETAGLEDFADELWRIDPSSPRDGGIDLRAFARR